VSGGLKVASGLLKPRAGRILVDGADVTGTVHNRCSRCGLSHVLQGHSVFREMTVAKNVIVGAYTLRDKALVESRAAQVRDLFRSWGGAGSLWPECSPAASRSRWSFPRSLMVSPKVVLLLDEPSMGLDPNTTGTVFEQIVRVRDAGTAVLLVEQNARRALAAADIGCVHISGPAPHPPGRPPPGHRLPGRPRLIVVARERRAPAALPGSGRPPSRAS
jgi:branched-chain amino acid transport system ATP-binding protein